MVSKVFEGTNVEIPAVLANRDRRVATQAQLLREHPSQVVVACKLNIPGPVKNSATIQAFFTAGLARLEDQWLACGQPLKLRLLGRMLQPVRNVSTYYIALA